MTVKNFLIKTNAWKAEVSMQKLRPPVTCKDGFQVSIQASSMHYCSPRQDMLDSYKKVELGFPNMEDDLILEYAEDKEDPTGTVYGYVPIEIVELLIEKHGGIERID